MESEKNGEKSLKNQANVSIVKIKILRITLKKFNRFDILRLGFPINSVIFYFSVPLRFFTRNMYRIYLQ